MNGLVGHGLKVSGAVAAVVAAAKGIVAFGAWRASLRDRLMAVEPRVGRAGPGSPSSIVEPAAGVQEVVR